MSMECPDANIQRRTSDGRVAEMPDASNEIRSFRAVRSKPTRLRTPSDERGVTRLSELSFDLAAVFSAFWQDFQATGQVSSNLIAFKNVSTDELSEQLPRQFISLSSAARAVFFGAGGLAIGTVLGLFRVCKAA